VVNFFNAVADECRHIMAKLGVAHLDDLIGRPEFLRIREVPHHPKANKLNLNPVLRNVAKEYDQDIARTCRVNRNEKLGHHPLDDKILQQAHVALTDQRSVTLSFKVKNRHRNIGTKLSGEIAYQHGNHGLPENTITLNLEGSAGQSLGTFLTTGVKIILTGEANDYVGKGMCGGEIVILPPRDACFTSWENSIIGNTVMYGATGGRLYAAGLAGERFCVRNSGGFAVVEGVGDHACEYMTGGTVVILGGCGKNFGAGMSGGVAYLLDEKGLFPQMVNPDMVKYEGLSADDDEILKGFIREHGEKTGSHRASHILDKWEEFRPFFVKVSPKFVPKPVEGDEVPVDTDDKSTPVKA
jgi:glutamate synthase domain-containing protein 3